MFSAARVGSRDRSDKMINDWKGGGGCTIRFTYIIELDIEVSEAGEAEG
jgi:hypothetical protein